MAIEYSCSVCAMLLVRLIVVVCCASVCVRGRKHVPEDGEEGLQSDSVEEKLRFGDSFETSDQDDNSGGVRNNFTEEERGEVGEGLGVLHKGPNTIGEDFQDGSAERVVHPVAYSYSRTTEPGKQVTALYQLHSSRVLPLSEDGNKLKYRVPSDAYSLVPAVHYSRLTPKISEGTPSEEEETSSFNEDASERTTYRPSVDDEEEEGKRPFYSVVNHESSEKRPYKLIDDDDIEERSNYSEVDDEDIEERRTYREIENEDSEENLSNGTYESEEDEAGGGEGSEEISQYRGRGRDLSEEENYRSHEEGEDKSYEKNLSSEDYQDYDRASVQAPKNITPTPKVNEFFKKNNFLVRNESKPQIVKGNTENTIVSLKEATSILPQSKQLQIAETGMNKVLSKPLKFAYTKDLRPSESVHKKNLKEASEKAGEEEDHSDHYSSNGERGEKGHENVKEHDKKQKGHLEKEAKEEKHSFQKGKLNEHKDDYSHVQKKKHKQKGKKGVKYAEKGHHEKGHSTKGEHNIHKKNEYVKNQEFYDEYHDSGEHEKQNDYKEKQGKLHGGKLKTGHIKAEYDEEHHGRKGHNEKGFYDKEHEGHNKKSGHKGHLEHEDEYAQDNDYTDLHKWSLHNKHE